jgi:hypothetical protein
MSRKETQSNLIAQRATGWRAEFTQRTLLAEVLKLGNEGEAAEMKERMDKLSTAMNKMAASNEQYQRAQERGSRAFGKLSSSLRLRTPRWGRPYITCFDSLTNTPFFDSEIAM